MGEKAPRLTIVVPTYNRYARLRRLLAYVRAMDTPYAIHVLDSSSDPLESDEVRQWLRDDGIMHRMYPTTITPMNKLDEGLRDVVSPYVVLWADDDFLVVRSLEAGIRFLEAHPDYSVMRGRSVLFSVAEVGGRREAVCSPYQQRAITAQTAAARLHDYFGRYSVVNYGIHRTNVLRDHVRLCCEHGFGYQWGELALGGLAVIQGNVGCLDQLYLVKEMHRGPDAWWAWLPTEERQRTSNDMFDWVTSSGFATDFCAFRDCLAEVLARQDGITVEEGRGIVKRAFWTYLVHAMVKKMPGSDARRARSFYLQVREAARRVPALRRAWRAVRSRMPGEEFSIEALCRSSSRYYTDVMPIYRAITSPPSESWPLAGRPSGVEAAIEEGALHG